MDMVGSQAMVGPVVASPLAELLLELSELLSTVYASAQELYWPSLALIVLLGYIYAVELSSLFLLLSNLPLPEQPSGQPVSILPWELHASV